MGITKLDEFLASNLRNEWIFTRDLKIYIRKGMRYINGVRSTTLEIGVAEVPDPKDRGKGIFKTEMMEKCPFRYAYVENVLTDQFASFFERNGWTIDPLYSHDRSFYKSISR